jgi:hypothetical protein
MRGLRRLDHLVELGGGYPPVVRVERLSQRGDDLVDGQAGAGADLQDRGIAEEPQTIRHLGSHVGAALGIEQVPFVEDDDDGGSRDIEPFRQTLILMGNALGDVDHQQRRVRLVDGL